MKIEQQVTSLELSKRLKELGVKQESYFWWVNGLLGSESTFAAIPKTDEEYSAFTVAELGELLPELYYDANGNEFFLASQKMHLGTWLVRYESDEYEVANQTSDKNEAEARGLMLAYLIENKHLNNPKD